MHKTKQKKQGRARIEQGYNEIFRKHKKREKIKMRQQAGPDFKLCPLIKTRTETWFHSVKKQPQFFEDTFAVLGG